MIKFNIITSNYFSLIFNILSLLKCLKNHQKFKEKGDQELGTYKLIPTSTFSIENEIMTLESYDSQLFRKIELSKTINLSNDTISKSKKVL